MTRTPTEAERQQALVQALWQPADAAALQGWLRPRPMPDAGLAAYRGNAAAIADRALASAYPTVAALVGAETFAALAQDLWRQGAPERGDLGEWGAALPELIAANAALASEPYLADSARLDWWVHIASRAADAPTAVPALDALASVPPAALRLVLRPGCALLASAWPVATLWHAHQRTGDDRFAAARAALAAGRGEHALVWRDGFAVCVEAVDAASAAFTASLLASASLAAALDAAGQRFAFDQWLVQALRRHWLTAVLTLEPR